MGQLACDTLVSYLLLRHFWGQNSRLLQYDPMLNLCSSRHRRWRSSRSCGRWSEKQKGTVSFSVNSPCAVIGSTQEHLSIISLAEQWRLQVFAAYVKEKLPRLITGRLSTYSQSPWGAGRRTTKEEETVKLKYPRFRLRLSLSVIGRMAIRQIC